MKKIVLLFGIVLISTQAFSQSAEDSVKAVINQLFSAMKNSDKAALLSCFADSAILQTITTSGRIRSETVAPFAEQIGKLPKGAADERIRFDVVKTDASLATVWTPYQFYYNGNFSHCGVNSFQLVRINGAWKIQYLIDTRRKDGCL
ncbi:nuclear transport factor 2 family protein [Flavisolibacter sp. BT320]|nr:nuclear transport factor 2 family protein [Flavisolibacter longurius]